MKLIPKSSHLIVSRKITFIGLLALSFVISSCKDDTDDDTNDDDTTTSVEVPAVYKKIYGASSITNDGTYITIKCTGLPDHKSPYYTTTNALYESFSGTTFAGYTFVQNPNTISTQNYTFKIPVNPAASSTHAATSMGAIGVSLNGIPLYNQYAAPNQIITDEISSFDKYYGHPTQTGAYHYHVEPLYLTTVKSSKSGLMGFLLDGFPVYGPQEEDGSTVVSADLDDYHGHTHATVDYPNGTYHYHFTADAPYLNGNGYYGTAGTVTQ